MLSDRAPAKINLSLHVRGRRAGGYHDLESLVVFADIADELAFAPGPDLALEVCGELSDAAGPIGENLVVKAAEELSARVAGLRLGHFRLTKRLPVAAGLGGGSADAAAALRLLASSNNIAGDDPGLIAAAMATGADVPVCLDPRPAMMRGAGEQVERLTRFPSLDLVLVNPRVAVETRCVFAELGLLPGAAHRTEPHPILSGATPAELADLSNDLAAPAERIAPVIAEVRAGLAQAGASVVRMSGSGATVWGLAASRAEAEAIAARLRARKPDWWIAATTTVGS